MSELIIRASELSERALVDVLPTQTTDGLKKPDSAVHRFEISASQGDDGPTAPMLSFVRDKVAALLNRGAAFLLVRLREPKQIGAESEDQEPYDVTQLQWHLTYTCADLFLVSGAAIGRCEGEAFRVVHALR